MTEQPQRYRIYSHLTRSRFLHGLENGPGQVIGEGAVKPAGEPEAVVNVPLTVWEARRLAFAILAHLDAWEVMMFGQRMRGGNR